MATHFRIKRKSHLQTGLLAELSAPRVGKVVVGERGVERGDEVEERLPGDGVAQGDLLLVRAPRAAGERPRVVRLRRGERVAAVAGGRRGEGLEGARGAALLAEVEPLVELLLSADHLAGVALDSGREKNNLKFKIIKFSIMLG